MQLSSDQERVQNPAGYKLTKTWTWVVNFDTNISDLKLQESFFQRSSGNTQTFDYHSNPNFGNLAKFPTRAFMVLWKAVTCLSSLPSE